VVVEELRKDVREIDTKEEIASVATNSAADPKIGELIADVMDKVGKDGVVTVEESKSMADETDFVEGMQFDRGYLSAYFITSADKMEAVISEPYIPHQREEDLRRPGYCPAAREARPASQARSGNHCRDIDGEALATLVLNKLRGMLNVTASRPGLRRPPQGNAAGHRHSHRRHRHREETGRKLETATIQDLGRAEKVVSDKENTTIIAGRAPSPALKPHQEIRAEMEKSTSDYTKRSSRAPGQTQRRRCCHQSRRANRNRAEGEEAPRGGCLVAAPRRAGRGHCRRWGDLPPQHNGTRLDKMLKAAKRMKRRAWASTSFARRSRPPFAGSPPMQARTAR